MMDFMPKSTYTFMYFKLFLFSEMAKVLAEKVKKTEERRLFRRKYFGSDVETMAMPKKLPMRYSFGSTETLGDADELRMKLQGIYSNLYITVNVIT